jgi:hypothetical protein
MARKKIRAGAGKLIQRKTGVTFCIRTANSSWKKVQTFKNTFKVKKR